MVESRLEIGVSLPGILVVGADEHFVSAMATLEAGRGVRIDVPFLHERDDPHYAPLIDWFVRRSLPSNLVFRALSFA